MDNERGTVGDRGERFAAVEKTIDMLRKRLCSGRREEPPNRFVYMETPPLVFASKPIDTV